MHQKQKPKVIVIVGPTASGKTCLAIHVALTFKGEVLSADSRQVYRGLDIGSGKVTKKEMGGVVHHLIDIADPMDVYTSADFVRDGRKALDAILAKGKLPIVAGGSFFYVDSLLGKITTPEVPPNPELREKLEKISTDSLYSALLKQDPRRAEHIDPKNKRRLVRALEIVAALGSVPTDTSEPLYETFSIGIALDKRELHANIHERLISRIEGGMIEEAEKLHAEGMTYERMEQLGLEYRYLSRYLQREITKEVLVEELEAKIRQFAKRQMTWLKRDTSIQWFLPSALPEIEQAVSRFLQEEK